MASISLKGGAAVDSDNLPTIITEPTALPGMSRIRSIPWDVERRNQTHADLVKILEGFKQTIYRAHLSLGPDSSKLGEYVEAMAFDVPDRNLFLDSWSLELGPITSHSLTSDWEVQCGWISLSWHGNGYLYPWTFPQLVAYLEKNEEIQSLMALCRRTWPVPSEPVDYAVMEVRKNMEDLWPYERCDLPWGWIWTLRETG